MKNYLCYFFVSILISCNTAKPITADVSTIALRSVNNYILKPNTTFSDSTTYRFFTREEDFHRLFTMTRVTRRTAIVPDFTTQSVVAIVLQPSEKIITLNFNKAEIAGTDLNIYYTVTDTTSWKNYPQTANAIAMLAKSTDVKKVHFFVRNITSDTEIKSNAYRKAREVIEVR